MNVVHGYLFILALISSSQSIYSSVPFKANPGCDLFNCTIPDNPAVFYGSQDINTSTIHLFYSSFDELTISTIETKKGHVPRWNYAELFERNYRSGVTFGTISPINSFSLVIRRLMKFTDKDDTGLINGSDTPIHSYWLRNLVTNFTSYDNDTDQPSFVLPLDDIDGTLTIDINYPGQSTRETKYPKLRSTPKTYILSITLEAKSIPIKSTRFALEFYLLELGSGGMKLSSTKYIDDQYTPGVFNVWQMKTCSPPFQSSMLWKPIVYQSSDRLNTESTLMHVYDLQNNIPLNRSEDQGIFLSFFTPIFVSAFNLSIGRTSDKYFVHTNYSFIQLSAGVDTLELDSTEEFIAIGLLISVSLPFLVSIVAIILIIRRRCSRPIVPTSYDPIYD